ncbi:MAG: DUF3552 domain-containing protein, partial [Bdellovibrionales bacterium]|nr:DUF3552 domain-containing protein [Bdellovibrionales bacterium]
MILSVLMYLILGLVLGSLAGLFLYNYWRKSLIKNAKLDAEDLIDDVKEALELKKIEQNERLTELEMSLWTKAEPELLRFENKISDLEDRYNDKKDQYSAKWAQKKSEYEGKHQLIRAQEIENKKLNMQMKDKKYLIKKELKDFIQKLIEKTNLNTDELKSKIKEDYINELNRQIIKDFESYEADIKERQEEIAKKILDTAVDRFARSYCPERGIAPVFFPDKNSRRILVDQAEQNIKLIQELCGCDILIEDENEMIGVAGFDPVRRELTRRVLKRLVKEKRPITIENIRK